jgi:hypothetical protein
MNGLCMRATPLSLYVNLISWFISAILTIVASSDADGKSVDVSSWPTHRVMLSDSELTFRIPGGDVPSEMPVPRPVERVDLDRDIPVGESGVSVFSRVWRYRQSFFWRKTLGYLVMAVGVRATDTALGCQSSTGLSDLEGSIRRRLEETYRGQELGSVFEVRVPDEYQSISVNRRRWLRYALGGFKDSIVYATPLSATRYLVITFDVISNTGTREAKWRHEAHSVASEVAASLVISGRDCR